MLEQLPLKFEFRADHTFDSFFPGNNQEVFNHLKRFTTDEGEQFIFLWGEPGYGKTHLLHSCCNEAFKNGLSSFYLDLAETELTDPELLTGLEHYGIVSLDNINLLVGKENWELAFFALYNQLRDYDGKLLISAASSPHALAFKLPDLRSRINWGLTLKLNAFDDDNKIAALSYKAHQKGFEISPQSARYLLTHYDRKLSSLWTMLDKLDTASLSAQRKLTIPFLKQIIEQDANLFY